MAVARPQLAVLVWLALLTFACLTSPAAADASDAPCLSTRVGEILSAKIAAHAFDGALPAGWTLEEVNVARDHIDLGALDAERRSRSVALRLGGEAAGAVDGRGRSFAFVIVIVIVIDAGGAPLDDAGKPNATTTTWSCPPGKPSDFGG